MIPGPGGDVLAGKETTVMQHSVVPTVHAAYVFNAWLAFIDFKCLVVESVVAVQWYASLGGLLQFSIEFGNLRSDALMTPTTVCLSAGASDWRVSWTRRRGSTLDA